MMVTHLVGQLNKVQGTHAHRCYFKLLLGNICAHLLSNYPHLNVAFHSLSIFTCMTNVFSLSLSHGESLGSDLLLLLFSIFCIYADLLLE